MLKSKMKNYQMGKYKIRVKVEFVEYDETEEKSPKKKPMAISRCQSMKPMQ